jgi:hypothetical protein
MTATAQADALADLAPGGKLRAAINLGNGVLAQKDAATGQPKGITPDLARELGRRLGVPVELVTYEAAGKVFDAASTGAWDIAFVAIEPVRASVIEFSAPYVIIEGTYMVRQDSPLKAIADVDRPGVRIAVGLKSAYDLYLTRTIKHATIVHASAGEAAAGGLCQGPSGNAGDGRPLHGNPAGDGHAQGPHRRRGLSARLRRGREGLGLCRRGTQAQQPDGDRGAAGGKVSAGLPSLLPANGR